MLQYVTPETLTRVPTGLLAKPTIHATPAPNHPHHLLHQLLVFESLRLLVA